MVKGDSGKRAEDGSPAVLRLPKVEKEKFREGEYWGILAHEGHIPDKLERGGTPFPRNLPGGWEHSA